MQEQALRLSPRDPFISAMYGRIGIAYLLQSRTDEAIVWLEKAREANPARSFRRIAMAQRIWNSAHDARGSPVVCYLASRGIPTIAPSPVLRYAPALRRPDGGSGPAMVALVEEPKAKIVRLKDCGSE